MARSGETHSAAAEGAAGSAGTAAANDRRHAATPPEPACPPAIGWSRADWERLADRALAAVRPYATPDHALIHLPGPESRSGRRGDGLQAFARTFLLAGFRLARGGERDPEGLAEWYAAGLTAGTDPDSAGRWPELGRCAQAQVECALMAIALHECRPWIWDRLGERARGNLVRWMSGVPETEPPQDSSTWSRAVTQAFLRSIGGPWRREDIEHALTRTEDWYIGDGWYSDGESAPGEPRCVDYYTGWAMHFYPLWYCRISGGAAEPGLLERYRDRLRRYLLDAQHLIGAGAGPGGGGPGGGVGRPLIHGRSLSYRFAMLAPFWAGAIFDATPLTPGRTRRLTSSVANHFAASGCFDESGLLPVGWHRAFEPLREHHAGGGAPYWAGKGFAGLVLPAGHPVWTAAEEALPIEKHDVSFALPKLGWIVSGTKHDGIVRVAQHGADHAAAGRFGIDVPGCGRHAYATHVAPEYGSLEPLDSHIGLVTADGRISHRPPALTVAAGVGRALSRHRAHWWRDCRPIPNDPRRQQTDHRFEAGPWLTTASLLHGPWEVRLARAEPGAATRADPGSPDLGDQWPTADGPFKLRFGGWALGLDAIVRPQVAGPVAWAVRPDGLGTTVAALRGDLYCGCLISQGTNPLGKYSAIPQAETVRPIEYGRIYAALVVLSGTLAGPQAVHGISLEVHGEDRAAADEADATGRSGAPDRPEADDETDGVLVTVQWPDGHRDELSFPA